METIFRLVLQTSLYASIAAIIIIILKAALKNRISPKWHYIIWIVFILKLLIPFGPESKVSLFNALPPAYQSMTFTQAFEQVQPNTVLKPGYDLKVPGTGDNAVPESTAGTEAALPYLWFMGAVLMAGWLLYTNHSLYTKLKKTVKVSRKEISWIFENCRKKTGVSKNIEVVVQDVITTPALIGVFKPKILLPISVLNLNATEISYIMLHELAHYKRKDMLASYLLLVLQIVHWFNPVIWYSFRRIRQDMELAADEKVLALLEGDEPKEYGKALLTVLANCNAAGLAPRLVGMVDDRKSIEKRIRMIKMAGFFKRKRKLVMATGLLCVLILSGLLLTNGLSGENFTLKSYPAGANGVKASPDIVFTDNDEIMKKYISDFLVNGYSKYYIINNIKFEVLSKKINEDKLEAIIFTTMNSNVPPRDPDTVPYIIQARENAQKETDAERKKILQKEYEILKNEYGKPDDTNFVFKLTAEIKENIIDQKTIELYAEQDVENNKVVYIPARDMLPVK